jgi:3-dehydroquinate dehydratase-1
MNPLTEALERPEPTIAVTIGKVLKDDALLAITDAVNVAEFRADLFPSHDRDFLTEQVGRLATLPILLTVRWDIEQGGWRDTEEDRFDLYADLLPYVDGVDVELAAGILPGILEMAHQTDKVVIGSSHNFKGTPSTDVLVEQLEKAQKLGVDYTKFAVSAKNGEDFSRMADFTLQHMHENLIVVAMDDYGPLSRITLPALGSHLTYAFPGEIAVAPGQLGYRETNELIQKLYPQRRLQP